MRRSIAFLPLAALAMTLSSQPSDSASTDARATDELTRTVTAMARIVRASAPHFSPDGKTIAFIADLSGVPQVWTMPTTGGYPEQVTTFSDPVIALSWSPNSDWLAVSVAPGGGLNSQIYLVRTDGSGLRRLTDGGKENNWLGEWTREGKYVTASSSRRDPAAMDSYLIDPATGEFTLVAENPGVGSIAGTSLDSRQVVVDRMRSRGDNDLFVIDAGSKRETRLTPHTPPAQFGTGNIMPDGRTIYVVS